MPRDLPRHVYVGIKHFVVALHEASGQEAWRAALHSADFVTVHWDGTVLLAASGGEVSRLDPANGAVLWTNELKGLGRGMVTLATSRPAPSSDATVPAAKTKKNHDAATAGAAAGAAAT